VTTLIIATRNSHKVEEIKAVLTDRFQFGTLAELRDAPAVVEDANSFAGNAAKKSLALAHWLAANPLLLGERIGRRSSLNHPLAPTRDTSSVDQIYSLADDSGLEVDVLNGAPGVLSARFAALDAGTSGNSPDAANNAKLLRLLNGVPSSQRTARFRCVIALTPVLLAQVESSVCSADPLEVQTEIFDGCCEGQILDSPRGDNGFGYDPLFMPDGYSQTFAELGSDVKNEISHRARALKKLREALFAKTQ
jgi:XTP/dITP diphosphohydrolase